MTERLATIWPEIIVLLGATVTLFLGLSPNANARRSTPWVAAASLVFAGLVAVAWPAAHLVGPIVDYVKLAIAAVGLLLLAVLAGVPDQLRNTRLVEEQQAAGRGFEPATALRGELFAFFLFSVTGAMITAGAADLAWLFLALELTSLPGYVMVATSRDRIDAQEAAVKYFFLGAMAAAMFLYGFTLIYGATGSTEFAEIRNIIAEQAAAGTIHPLLVAGFVLSILGIAFKIAAAPMHGYVADVYQGASVAVTAFLAFIPKMAGFVALILLLALVPAAELPEPIFWLLWLMAAATMTIGNLLGLMQRNVKRVLAYSSVAHSGYMLVPLIAGVVAAPGQPLGDTAAAVLFYLVAYGLATIGAFAVLGCLHQKGEEAQTFDDIAGLVHRQPALAAIMLLSVLSLIGLPPMVGFIGKVFLFSAAIDGTHASAPAVALVVIAVVNSAISAVYYLRIASACFFGEAKQTAEPRHLPARRASAAFAALAALVLGLAANTLVNAAREAGLIAPPIAEQPQEPRQNSLAAEQRG